MNLSSIAKERELKLKSLLTNQIEQEIALFRTALTEHPLDAKQNARIERALEFNLKQNYGSRDLDRYYAAHPVRVARFMAEWITPTSGHVTDAIVAAILHNVLEKKLSEPIELKRMFGDWVASGLRALVPDRAAMAEEKGRLTYYSSLFKQPPEIQAIKLFDKFDNLFALCLNPDNKVRHDYLEEIEQHVRPIAERLAPDLIPYLDSLIHENRRTGYYRPEFRET